MTILRDPKLEKFAQELAASLNDGLSERKAAAIASVKADYPQGTSAAKNAHKRALRADVKGRVAELRAPGIKRAEEAIGITTEYLLAKLDNLAAFNPDDYLSEPDEEGERHYTLAGVPRDLIGRLASAKIGRFATGRGRKRKVLTFVADVSGHDPIAAIKLMAQICGLMKPDKLEISGHDGTPITPTIILTGRPGTPPAP